MRPTNQTAGILAGLVLWTGVLTVAVAGTQPPPAGVSIVDAAATVEEQLAIAFSAVDDNDPTTTGIALTTLMAHPDFDALPADIRHVTFSAAGWTAIQLSELARARDFYLAAINLSANESHVWYQLALLEFDLDNPEASADRLLHLLQHWPELQEELPDGYFAQLVRELIPFPETRLTVLHALLARPWTLNGLGTSHFWHELALMQVERGDTDAARASIEHIDGPMELVMLRIDRRFDALVDPTLKRFDIQRAARLRSDDLRTKAMLAPERLDLLMELTYAMLAAGEERQVLAMTDAALAALSSTTVESALFENIEDQVWLMNNRAIALRRLDRIDEALVQMEIASGFSENGGANVSQALNLGRFYCSLGRFPEALAAISSVNDMSDYGRMVRAAVQHCAMRRSGDATGADEALAYLRDHSATAPSALLQALLEANHLDEAAGTLASLLESTETRLDTLVWVQRFRSLPPLPADHEYRSRREELLARDDVIAAVERVGRIGQYDIHARSALD